MNSVVDFSYHPTMKGHVQKVLNGEYDIKNLELPEKPVILDIGANCGAFAKWALDKWPDAELWLFEPNPEAVEYLHKNFAGDGRVTIIDCAVTDTDADQVKLYKGKHNIGECSIYDCGEQEPESITVCTFAPQDLPEADFIKIDAEGAEVEILKEYKHKQELKAIALEYHGQERGQQCYELITGQKLPLERFEHRGIIKVAQSDENAAEAKPIDTSELFIGIPVHYQPTCAFSISCMALERMAPGAKWEFLQGDSHPDRARNNLAKKFLASDKEYLLFLDADLKFNPRDVLRLLEHRREMVCGFYAKKTPGKPQWVGNALNTDKDADGLTEMREAATGLLLIHRSVFEKVAAKYPELEYTEDPHGKTTAHSFFQSGVYYDEEAGRTRWLSEDWAFSLMARKAGVRIWGDTSVVALHEGACLFPTEPEGEE